MPIWYLECAQTTHVRLSRIFSCKWYAAARWQQQWSLRDGRHRDRDQHFSYLLHMRRVDLPQSFSVAASITPTAVKRRWVRIRSRASYCSRRIAFAANLQRYCERINIDTCSLYRIAKSACLPEHARPLPCARSHSPACRILTYLWPLFSALCDMRDNGCKLSSGLGFARVHVIYVCISPRSRSAFISFWLLLSRTTASANFFRICQRIKIVARFFMCIPQKGIVVYV